MLSDEMNCLALYAIFTMAVILAQVIAAQMQVGLAMLIGPRDNMPPLTGTAGRLFRAQANSIAALALMAPAVLMLQKMGYSTGSTVAAAQIFLIARVVYVPAYVLGLPWVRTLAWVVGFYCTGWLYFLAAF
ncbi:MAG: MAPEG family protein [Paracoccaceae bacterium]